jgi:hypothetical protein
LGSLLSTGRVENRESTNSVAKANPIPLLLPVMRYEGILLWIRIYKSLRWSFLNRYDRKL